MIVAVRYRTGKETGPSLDAHAQLMMEEFVRDVLSDCQNTPQQFPPPPPPPKVKGKKRKRVEGLPYYRTGTLVDGLYFRAASRGGMRAGLLGWIVAPETRFNLPRAIARRMRDGFTALIDKLHKERGVGWSRSRKGGG